VSAPGQAGGAPAEALLHEGQGDASECGARIGDEPQDAL
jgi:hypothetical protein